MGFATLPKSVDDTLYGPISNLCSVPLISVSVPLPKLHCLHHCRCVAEYKLTCISFVRNEVSILLHVWEPLFLTICSHPLPAFPYMVFLLTLGACMCIKGIPVIFRFRSVHWPFTRPCFLHRKVTGARCHVFAQPASEAHGTHRAGVEEGVHFTENTTCADLLSPGRSV